MTFGTPIYVKFRSAMFRNSSAKSSISVAKLFTCVREVVVEVHRRNRREQPGRRGDQRLADAGRHDRQVRRAGRADPVERNHDAPHRAEQADERRDARGGREKRDPAARACSPRSSAARSSARSTAVETLEGWTSGGAAVDWAASCRGMTVPELRVHLGVAGLEHADERAGGQRRADGLHFRELAAAAEDVEKASLSAVSACGTSRPCRG